MTRLRTIRATGGSKSRRMNRKRAKHLRGQIKRLAQEKAYVGSTVTGEVNPHGTSQYCSRCGAKGERFSILRGQRLQAKWGKLFRCAVCQYEANADFNASVNVHRSFYREWHWQIRKKPPPRAAKRSSGGDPLSPATGRGEEASQRDTPTKTGKPGRLLCNRQGGTAIVGLETSTFQSACSLGHT